MKAQISRDPFARTTLVRFTSRIGNDTCDWCGGRRPKGGLFQYVTETDNGRQSGDDHRFCLIGCYRSFHS